MKVNIRRNLFWNALKGLISIALLLTSLVQVSPALAGGQTIKPDVKPLTPVDTAGQKDLRILSSTAQDITVEFQLPEYSLESAMVAGKACQYPRIEGYGFSDQVGRPMIPVRGVMIGIPAQAQPRLIVLAVSSTAIAQGISLCPVQPPSEEGLPDSGLPSLATDSARYEQAVLRTSQWPENVAELAGQAMIRDQRVAEIKLFPFQYRPGTGELIAIQRLTFRLEFGTSAIQDTPQQTRGKAQGLNQDFEKYLQATILNYTAAQSWRAEPEQAVLLRSADTPAVLPPSYKIAVSREGIYQLTYERLAAAAGAELPSALPAQALHLTVGGDRYHGREVAIEVQDGGDGLFNAGDAILFYGQPVDTKYSGTNIYYLSWDEQAGKRMQWQDSTPDGRESGVQFWNKLHLEQNLKYLTNYPSGATKDVWYWDYVQANGSKSFTFTLPSLANLPTATARLSGLLRGYSGIPQHHTRIYLNGILIDDAFWYNNTSYLFTKDIPQSYLMAGVNTIKVEALLDNGITSNLVLINWFEVEYWDVLTAAANVIDFTLEAGAATNPELTGFSTDQLELFDISDPEAPQRLINYQINPAESGYSVVFHANSASRHTYWAQAIEKRLQPDWIARDQITNWRSPDYGADYIVITHSTFLSAAQRLADYRHQQGLRTQVVNVEDLYDEFSGGIITPLAIRDFLAYAYAYWQRPAPLFVVLMGDGHYDPRNYLGSSGPFFIPPYLEFVDYWSGETASDNRFVTVSGDDGLPDLFIGRLPVNSASQAEMTVDKILAYEQNPSASGWNAKLLFVTDNADAAGDFAYYSDKVVNGYVPASYTSQKIYYGITHTDIASTRTAILNALNNDGALILNYVGHGSIRSWASENLFNYSSLTALNNANKLPFVASMSCLVGAFHYPKFPGTDTTSLAEGLVVSSPNGAIASFASAGNGLATGQDYLNRGLFQSIFMENQTLLGPAVTRAKLYLYANTTGYQDLVDLFTLFGDPATRLNVLAVPKATIGDRIWHDLNGNGLQDPGEPGLSDVPVALYAADGRLVAATRSDQQGIYIFNNVEPGTSYFLAFNPPVGFRFSPANASAADELNSDVDPLTGRTGLISSQAGEQNFALDAGLFQSAAIGNRVWEDLNANGIQEAEEPGLAGVPVHLFTASGTLVTSTTTDAQGYYRFEDLLPGDYFLQFEHSDEYQFSPQTASSDPALDSDADPASGQSAVFTLQAGTYDDTRDAGLFRLAAVGDFVWLDKNKNGVQDRTESGVGGVKVSLYTADGILVARTTTNPSGAFLFTNLQPGSYYLVFYLPRGYTSFTILNPQAGVEFDSNVINSTGATAVFCLLSGQTDLSQDAGLVKGALK